MSLSPDLSFLSAFVGTLFIYIEFLRPGRVLPGLIGGLLLVFGCYGVWQNGPSRRGLLFIAVSLLLFLLEAFYNTRFLAGILGTASLAAGALLLFTWPLRIHPVLAGALPVLFGSLTTFLANLAKRARQNKWADLSKDR